MNSPCNIVKTQSKSIRKRLHKFPSWRKNIQIVVNELMYNKNLNLQIFKRYLTDKKMTLYKNNDS